MGISFHDKSGLTVRNLPSFARSEIVRAPAFAHAGKCGVPPKHGANNFALAGRPHDSGRTTSVTLRTRPAL